MDPATDVYFSADVETDGPIPGPFSMLSVGFVLAGTYDGQRFIPPRDYEDTYYAELRPISDTFDSETLLVSGLDRGLLTQNGTPAATAMEDAARWVRARARRHSRPGRVPGEL